MNSAVCLCILLSLLSGLVAVAHTSYTVPPKCCKPSVFQATATDIRSYAAGVVTQVRTFVDYRREMQVNKIFRQERNKAEMIFISRVVLDFAHGWMFEFPNQPSSKCYRVPLPILMSLQCVPDWATYIGSDYIGPERTLFDVWTADQTDVNVNLTYAFTRDHCTPVFSVQKGKLFPENVVVDMTTLFTNVSTTVDDMSVFDYPNNCVLSNKAVDMGYAWGAAPDPE